MKHLLSLLLLLTCLSVSAEEFTYTYNGQTLTYTIIDEKEGTCALKNGENLTGNVAIPEYAGTSKKYKVIKILGFAFWKCSDMTSVTIPNSVTSIGNCAFYSCSSMTSVTIPNSVIFIDGYAFSNCHSLTYVNISDITAWCNIKFSTKSSNPLSLSCYLYLNGEQITDLVIPNGVTSIGDYAFANCAGLTSVTIPNSVTSIGFNAFSSGWLLSYVNISDITAWCNIKFGGAGANPLANAYNFYLNGELITDLVIPNGVTSIGDNVFKGSRSLTSVTIPNSVTSIGDYAFGECVGLTSVIIPNSVTSIGDYAFSGCGMTSVTIPNSVASIGDYAFKGCDNLIEIYSLALTPPKIDYYTFDKQHYQNAKLFVLDNLDAYRTTDKWKQFNSIELYYVDQSGITYSYNNEKMTATLVKVYDKNVPSDFVIPATVTNQNKKYDVVAIGDYAFEGCSGMTSVTIPNSITFIGNNAFKYCSGLESVNISDITAWYNIYFSNSYANPLNYAQRLYLNGEEVKNLVIPEGVTYISQYAFYYCGSLTSVIIPNSVTSIGCDAFHGCDNLTEIYSLNPTPPSVDVSINSDNSDGCFDYRVYKGAKLYVQDNENAYLAASPWNKFENMICMNHSLNFSYDNDKMTATVTGYNGGTPLLYIEIPATTTYQNRTYDVVAIGDYAFNECTKLTCVRIPEGITSIGDLSFANCISLSSVTIPNSVTSLGEGAFGNCPKLSSITIPNKVTSIGSSVFEYCSGLTSVVIPNSITSISNGAFKDCTGLTSVTIPNSVTSIGGDAFYGCCSLTSVIIPNSVTIIGDNAFGECSGLTSVIIPKNVTSIGRSAFSGCTSLTEIKSLNSTPPSAYEDTFDEQHYQNAKLNVPQDALSAYKAITPWCAFLNTPNLAITDLRYSYDDSKMTATVIGFNGEKTSSDLVIPATTTYQNQIYNVVAIGERAFENCSSLKYVFISEGITTIGSEAFSGCSDLLSVTIPNSMTSIKKNAFLGCQGLNAVYVDDLAAWCNIEFDLWFESSPLYWAKNLYLNKKKITDLVIPDGVTSIGTNAFEKCNVTSVTIPNSVRSIGDFAFRDCYYLTSATIPNSVTSIGYESFSYCGGLTSITIPNSVTSIGGLAFYGCSNLTKIYSLNPTPPNAGLTIYDTFYSAFDENIYQNATLYVPQESIEVYKKAEVWREFYYTQKIESMGIKYSYDTSNMTATVIGYDKYSLPSNLDIPTTTTYHNQTYDVVAIGDGAFHDCSGLTSVIIPNSVSSLGNGTFSYCSSLTSVIIPNSVTSIGDGAFMECSGLTSVIIPNSVTSIGDDTFEWCSSLTSVIIPNSVTSIGDDAFSRCSSLTSVIIPNNVTSIGDWAFYDCSGLTKIYSLNITPPSADFMSFAPVQWYINVTLYVPQESLEAYKTADVWKNFYNIQGIDPSGIHGIEIDPTSKKNVYYDLNGRRLETPRKGLNIINGKKVIIK